MPTSATDSTLPFLPSRVVRPAASFYRIVLPSEDANTALRQEWGELCRARGRTKCDVGHVSNFVPVRSQNNFWPDRFYTSTEWFVLLCLAVVAVVGHYRVSHLPVHLGWVNFHYLAQMVLPNSHQPKQNQSDGGTLKFQVNPPQVHGQMVHPVLYRTFSIYRGGRDIITRVSLSLAFLCSYRVFELKALSHSYCNAAHGFYCVARKVFATATEKRICNEPLKVLMEGTGVWNKFLELPLPPCDLSQKCYHT